MEYLGYLAGGLTTEAFVPQVWKSVRSRSVKDLSIVALLMFNTGVALWIVYGWSLRSTPVIVANVATLVLIVPLVVLKFAPKRPNSPEGADQST